MLQKVVRREEPVVVFPTGNDETVRMLAALAETSTHPEINFAVPTRENQLQLGDNERLYHLASDYDILVPESSETYPVAASVPFVAKPKQESTNAKTTLVLDEETYYQFPAYGNKDYYFYQEFVYGSSYYYCAVYDDGEVVADFSQQTIIQAPNGGSVIKARPATLPSSLYGRFNEVLADLSYTGPMMVEFRGSNNDYTIIEVNPRFGGPSS